MKRIAILGAGNMGSAFFAGLRGAGSFDIVVCDKNAEKLEPLGHAQTTTDAQAACENADAVLLAVKPQSAKELLLGLPETLNGTLIVSIMAGISLQTLEEWTGSPQIVRAMPNLPAKLGKGLTGWIAGRQVTDEGKELARSMFASVGTQVEVTDEPMIDTVTALSGSGPAYFFLLTEILAAKAQEEGFDALTAARISTQTLTGSAALLEQSDKTPEEWRAAVTSKGGTTQAALESLAAQHFRDILFSAIDAAIARSRELNR